MKILITGGTGNVGRAVTERFIKKGWDVRVIGLEDSLEIADAEYIQADIANYEAVSQVMQDREAVVHLAAISHPMLVPAHQLFQLNVAGTFNVFSAAAEAGIRRIVQASSINAFGCFWGNTDIDPQYISVDEQHPTYTTDAYSFSKEAVEDIGHYFWRRVGLSSLAIRLPGVWSAGYFENETRQEQAQDAYRLIDEFARQPEAERATRLESLQKSTVTFRKQGSMEYPAAKNGFPNNAPTDDPLWPSYAFHRFNFWAYIHERDSAQAMEKGVTAAFSGSHPLFINASNNSLGYKSQALARLFFPKAQVNPSLTGTKSLVSIAKARELIGFEPEYLV